MWSTVNEYFSVNLKRKIKEVYKLFDMKKVHKKLTLEEKNAHADIEVKRAEY